MLQHQARHVAVELLFELVRIVKAPALAVGIVAAVGILGDRRRTQHHDVVLVRAVQTLAVRPGVLAVPILALAPARADGLAGIERGDLVGILLAIRVAIQFLRIVIAGRAGLLGGQHGVQRLAEVTVIDGLGAGRLRAALFRQHVEGIAAGVIRRGIGGQEGRGGVALAPVVDVVSVFAIDDLRCTGRLCGRSADGQAGEHAAKHCKQQQNRHNPFGHGISSSFIIRLHPVCPDRVLCDHFITKSDKKQPETAGRKKNPSAAVESRAQTACAVRQKML